MSEQQQEETTAHDDVAAAFDSVEEPDANASPIVDPPVDAGAVQTELTGLSPVSPDQPPAPEPGAQGQPAPDAAPPPELGAPQSWGVAERELWAGLDPSVKAQIDKREKEISEGLTFSGDSRQFQDEFNQTIAPYQQLIAAENSTPMATVGALLQTASSLMSGTPQTKAETAAQIIQQYGVDLHMLDSLLAGQMPENNPNTQMEQMLDQRLAPMNNWMQQQQNQQQQQYNQQYQSNQDEINQFMGAHEFANDVSAQMGDLMQMAAQRNQPMTLDEAYRQAILLRPDIQQVIQQREAGAAAQVGNQQVAQKRGAAVSLQTGAAPQGGAPIPDSMRDAIAAAMDNSR